MFSPLFSHSSFSLFLPSFPSLLFLFFLSIIIFIFPSCPPFPPAFPSPRSYYTRKQGYGAVYMSLDDERANLLSEDGQEKHVFIFSSVIDRPLLPFPSSPSPSYISVFPPSFCRHPFSLVFLSFPPFFQFLLTSLFLIEGDELLHNTTAIDEEPLDLTEPKSINPD